MKTKIPVILLILAAVIAFAFGNRIFNQDHEPWTKVQLLAPAALAKTMNNPEEIKPVIFSVGPAGLIKGSVDIGPSQEKQNLQKLKNELAKLPKDKNIVIYCGCCPFKDCPNIRPAFKLLNEMKFTNHKLLDLSQNLKADWIDKGYPVSE